MDVTGQFKKEMRSELPCCLFLLFFDASDPGPPADSITISRPHCMVNCIYNLFTRPFPRPNTKQSPVFMSL